jgi:hypothetical protein
MTPHTSWLFLPPRFVATPTGHRSSSDATSVRVRERSAFFSGTLRLHSPTLRGVSIPGTAIVSGGVLWSLFTCVLGRFFLFVSRPTTDFSSTLEGLKGNLGGVLLLLKCCVFSAQHKKFSLS